MQTPIVVELTDSFDDFASPPPATRNERSATVTTDQSSEDLFVMRNTTRVRFVAGEHFYNVELFGSLRKGGEVQFFSRGNLGLCVAVMLSVFSYDGLENVILPLLKTQLNLTQQEALAMKHLVKLPMALSFLLGLLSDSYPILGMRRKSYMVLGSLLFGASAIVIGGITSHFDSSSSLTKTESPSPGDAHVVFVILLCAFGSVGCIFTYLCVHTHVIELSQREPLRTRGSFQASYLILRHLTSLLSSLFTYAALRSEAGDPREMRPCVSIFLLAIIAIVPLPVVWEMWREDNFSCPAASTSFPARASAYWRTVQQKAVWRILVFICVFTLFLNVNFYDSARVVSQWAGASADNYLVVSTIQDLVILLSIVVWRQWCLNLNWRILFSLGPVFAILPQLFVSIFVALDMVRDRYFYRVITSLSFVANGVTLLMTIVPVTEIIQEGAEASTVGLVLTFQRLIATFDSTNNGGLFQGDNFFNSSQVASDSSSIRSSVLLSLMLNYGINALALGGIFFIPRQKLDAQQLRIYGGFTKAAAQIIAGFGLALFVYTAVMNIMSFSPSLACHRLVGGDGCS